MTVLKRTLEEQGEHLRHLASHSLCRDADDRMCKRKYNLLSSKLNYPYSLLKDCESAGKITTFPSLKDFENDLTDSTCSDSEYKKSEAVWQEFSCENLLDFTRIYQKLDVILLADVMCAFKDLCKTQFGLYPDDHYTLPSFALQCCYKILGDRNVDLKLIKDKKIYDFVNSAKRGGLCTEGFSRVGFASEISDHMEAFSGTRYYIPIYIYICRV